MSGPMSVSSSRGSPWPSARGPLEEARAELVVRCRPATSIRTAARQTCPALSNCSTARSTARSRSASSNTSSGDFPPSSKHTGVMLRRRGRARSRPAVGTEPVKQSRPTPGCAASGAPASAPVPWTTLRTPGGRPASAAMSASSDAVSGAHSGGLSDDGVARGERRADPPGREHQRRVPRRDDRGDAGRVPGDLLAVPAGLQVRVAERRAGSRRRSGSCSPPGA